MQLLFLQEWFSGEVLKAVGWTLIHSLWQGLLAAVMAGIIIISTKKSVARIRYNLLGIVLFLFISAAIITFFLQLKEGIVETNTLNRVSVAEKNISFITTSYEVTPAQVTAVDKFIGYFNANVDVFVLIWAIFFFVHCLKLMAGLAGIQRLRNYRTHASPAEWQIKLNQLRNVLAIKQTVGLLQSELIKVPVAIGFFKPVILVPLGLLSNLPPEQVETILLHELAHIRRKDYFVNILQRFTEAVFFFNPALLWISSLIRQEREACCDDIVVSNITQKGSYLEALVSFQEYSFAASRYAMAINSKKHYLLNRVKRMITRENKKLDIMEKILLAIGLIAVTAFTLVPKKDAIKKSDITATTFVKEPAVVASTQTGSLVPPDPEMTYKAVKKENRKAAREQSNSRPTDTVPSKKEKTDHNDLKFPGISSTINVDGNTKTETTTVTDGNGKKYTYTKLNNKITSLTVDGKNIPENEIGNYSELLEKIEMVIQESKARRLTELQRRKFTMTQRNEDMKARVIEKRLSREYQNLHKQYLLQQNKQLRRLNKSEKNLDSQRKEMRLLQQLKEKRLHVPMLNGREISQNDIHVDKSTTGDVHVEMDISNETAKVLQKNMDLKKAIARTPQKNVINKKMADVAVKSDLNITIDNLPVNELEYKLTTDQPKPFQYKKTSPVQPALRLNKAREIKLSPEAMPVKPGSHLPAVKGRMIS